MENIVKRICLFEVFECGFVSQVAANDVPVKADKVFVMSETFQVAVGKGLFTAEFVKNDNTALGKVFLKVKSQISTDETCTAGNKNGFMVEIDIVVAHGTPC